MLLGLPQLGHGSHEGYQVRDERDRRERAVPGDLASQRDQPGGAAELVTVTGAPGQAPVGGAGGTVVGVGGAPQLPAAQRPRRDMKRVSRRPGGVGRRDRITVGAAANVLRRRSGLAGRVGVDGVAFRGGKPERSRVLRATAPAARADEAG